MSPKAYRHKMIGVTCSLALNALGSWGVAVYKKRSLQKGSEFANSIESYEVAHNEPPHLDLCCLPSSIN